MNQTARSTIEINIFKIHKYDSRVGKDVTVGCNKPSHRRFIEKFHMSLSLSLSHSLKNIYTNRYRWFIVSPLIS